MQNRNGETPLYLAIKRSSKKTTDILLEYGADLNIPDNHGRTPRDIAKKIGLIQIPEQYLSLIEED